MSNKTETNQLDEKGQKTGLWEEYFRDGKLSSAGEYVNGAKSCV